MRNAIWLCVSRFLRLRWPPRAGAFGGEGKVCGISSYARPRLACLLFGYSLPYLGAIKTVLSEVGRGTCRPCCTMAHTLCGCKQHGDRAWCKRCGIFGSRRDGGRSTAASARPLSASCPMQVCVGTVCGCMCVLLLGCAGLGCACALLRVEQVSSIRIPPGWVFACLLRHLNGVHPSASCVRTKAAEARDAHSRARFLHGLSACLHRHLNDVHPSASCATMSAAHARV